MFPCHVGDFDSLVSHHEVAVFDKTSSKLHLPLNPVHRSDSGAKPRTKLMTTVLGNLLLSSWLTVLSYTFAFFTVKRKTALDNKFASFSFIVKRKTVLDNTFVFFATAQWITFIVDLKIHG